MSLCWESYLNLSRNKIAVWSHGHEFITVEIRGVNGHHVVVFKTTTTVTNRVRALLAYGAEDRSVGPAGACRSDPKPAWNAEWGAPRRPARRAVQRRRTTARAAWARRKDSARRGKDPQLLRKPVSLIDTRNSTKSLTWSFESLDYFLNKSF